MFLGRKSLLTYNVHLILLFAVVLLSLYLSPYAAGSFVPWKICVIGDVLITLLNTIRVKYFWFFVISMKVALESTFFLFISVEVLHTAQRSSL